MEHLPNLLRRGLKRLHLLVVYVQTLLLIIPFNFEVFPAHVGNMLPALL